MLLLRDDLGMVRASNIDNQLYDQFMLKTLKINWEGNTNSFMHVLINTTSIVELEEAKNDIRCQKIMFASASHEFRTPLNAILNSLNFIRDFHQTMLDQIEYAVNNDNRLSQI